VEWAKGTLLLPNDNRQVKPDVVIGREGDVSEALLVVLLILEKLDSLTQTTQTLPHRSQNQPFLRVLTKEDMANGRVEIRISTLLLLLLQGIGAHTRNPPFSLRLLKGPIPNRLFRR